jgi:putative inorganic carbon (HCO3(-)) transporter
MRDLAVVLIFLAALTLTFRSVTTGILLWVWAITIDLNHQLYGFAMGIPYQKIVAAITICLYFATADRKRIYLDRSLFLMLTFLLIGLISQSGTITSQPGGWEIFGKLGKIIPLAFILSWTLWDRMQIHALVLAICLGLGVTGVWEGTLFFVSGAHHHVLGSASLGDNNEVALLISMIIPLAYYVFTVSVQPLVRFASMGACILFVACVLATQSRGGFIALLTIAIAAAAFSKRKVTVVAMMAVMAIGFALVVPQSWTQRMDTIQTADQDNSFMGRVVAWKMSTLIALDHPFFGGGFHAVQHQDVWDHYKPSFDKLSFIPTDEPSEHPHAAHSLYFETLGDTGFMGLGVVLLILATAFGNVRAIKRLSHGRDELQWAHSLASMLQISLLVLAISGAALSTTYMDLNFLLFAILSVLRRQLEAAAEPEPRRAGVLAVAARAPLAGQIGRGGMLAGATSPWRATRR